MGPSRAGGRPPKPKPRIPTPPQTPSIEPEEAPEWRHSPAAFQATGPVRGESPEEAFDDVRMFVKTLASSDKLAFLGAMITVVVSFFPWKETAAEGESIGIMSLALPVFFGAVIVIVAIVIRVRALIPRLNPIFPWLAQLSCACFGILWTLVFIKVSWDGTQVRAPVGNLMTSVSSPAAGALAGLVGCLVAAAGTLMGLKEKPS